jgi:hypothetical protein
MQAANGFYLEWAVSGAVLVIFAALIGRATGYGVVGILIDNRGRYSLNRLQLVIWTLLVLSTLLGLFFSSGYTKAGIDAAFTIPQTLLVLMGISVGSATVAGAVKSNKDLTGNVQTAGILPPTAALAKAAVAKGAVGPVLVKPHFAQIFLEEEGSQIDNVIDVSKFQNFFFTLALAVTFVVLVANSDPHAYPQFSEQVLWLLGLSHAGYVGGKLPTKA